MTRKKKKPLRQRLLLLRPRDEVVLRPLDDEDDKQVSEVGRGETGDGKPRVVDTPNYFQRAERGMRKKRGKRERE